MSGASLDETIGNVPDRAQAPVVTHPAHTPEDMEPGKFNLSTVDDPTVHHNSFTPHDPPYPEDLPMSDDPLVVRSPSPNDPLTPNQPPATDDDEFLLSQTLSKLLVNEHLLDATTEVEVNVHSPGRSRKRAPKKAKPAVKSKRNADKPETLEPYSGPKEGSTVYQQASFPKPETTNGNGNRGSSSNNNPDDYQDMYNRIIQPAMAALLVFMSVYQEGNCGDAVRNSLSPLKACGSLLMSFWGLMYPQVEDVDSIKHDLEKISLLCKVTSSEVLQKICSERKVPESKPNYDCYDCCFCLTCGLSAN
jgi:hypothetical protein